MNDPGAMVIDGVEYTASLFEPGLWIIRRNRNFRVLGFDDECQVRVDTLEPEVAIRAAIAQDSWA